MRGKKSKSETALQMACAGFLDNRLLPPAFYSAFPAGGGGEWRGKILKQMGLKAGVPDLLLFRPLRCGDGACVLGIELKVGNNWLTDSQEKTFPLMAAAGVLIAVVTSLDQLKVAVTQAGFALRPVSKSTERLMLSLSSWNGADLAISTELDVVLAG